MAERRMFAKSVIESDSFLDLPMSARLLYYDLGMRGDDDGFVDSPKRIMRLTGASEDDIKLLITKQFLIPFDSGVVVIRHWKIHNYLRSDRYKGTQYQVEKSILTEGANGIYCLSDGIPAVYQASTDRLPDGSITKNRLKKDKYICAKAHLEETFEVFWKAYPKKVGKGAARKAWDKIKPNAELHKKIITAVEKAKNCDQWQRDNGQYIPHPTTWLNQGRWDDELSIGTKAQTSLGAQVNLSAEDMRML